MYPLFEPAILMNDIGASPKSRKRKTAGAAKADAGALRAMLSAAILQVMDRLKADRSLPAANAEQDWTQFADTVADMALGNAVVLRLQDDLPEARKESVKTFADALARVSGTLEENRLEAAIGKLAEVLLPDELEEARGVLAADNLELRDRFLRDVPQLSSVDISRQSGSSAKNSYATAARWKKNGEIFSVQHRGAEFFPTFQFRDGRPHPAVRQVLEALPSSMTAWQKAFWFVSANGWLDDRPPAELLDDAQALVAAARAEHEEVMG